MPLGPSELRLAAMNFLEASQDFVYGIPRNPDETKVETLFNRVLQRSEGKGLSEIGSIRFGVRGGNPTLVTLGRFIKVTEETQDFEDIKKIMKKLTKDDESGQLALETLLAKLEEVNESSFVETAQTSETDPVFKKAREDHCHQRSSHYRVKDQKMIVEFREETKGWGSAELVFDLSEKTITLKSTRTDTETYSFSRDLDMKKLEYALNHCVRGSALERFFLRASMEGSLKNYTPAIDALTIDNLFKNCESS